MGCSDREGTIYSPQLQQVQQYDVPEPHPIYTLMLQLTSCAGESCLGFFAEVELVDSACGRVGCEVRSMSDNEQLEADL